MITLSSLEKTGESYKTIGVLETIRDLNNVGEAAIHESIVEIKTAGPHFRLIAHKCEGEKTSYYIDFYPISYSCPEMRSVRTHRGLLV